MTKLTINLSPEGLLTLKAACGGGVKETSGVKEQHSHHRDQKISSNEEPKNNQTSEQVEAQTTLCVTHDGTHTPVVKKEIKQQRHIPYVHNARIMNALNWLYVTFSKLFKRQEKVPLKVGVLCDIFAWIDVNKEHMCEEERVGIPTKTAIRDAVTFYTTNRQYQHALIEQDKRYNL